MSDSFEGQDFKTLTDRTQLLIIEALKGRMPVGCQSGIYRYDGKIYFPGVSSFRNIHNAEFAVSGYAVGYRRAWREAQEAKERSDRARRAARIGARKRAKAKR